MIYFLWLIFLLFIGGFLYRHFRQKEKRPLPKQVVIKAKNGKTKIIILRNK